MKQKIIDIRGHLGNINFVPFWAAVGACFTCLADANLLKNGDFEDGLNGWAGWTTRARPAAVAEKGCGGKACLSYAYDDPRDTACFVRSFAVKPETTYTAKGRLKGAGDQAAERRQRRMVHQVTVELQEVWYDG